jgi:glycosyltransferase involved in cell wall biosynthesis
MSYIPNLEGYFTHRLDVLKLSLESLVNSLEGVVDIMVMNNGSCQEVSDFLQGQLKMGRIDYLIHSRRNLGVIGGFKILFNAVPGELIAYCDDDVFYYPGWLEAHQRILDTFPDVGMVSGAPVGYSSEEAVSAVESFIHTNVGQVIIKQQARKEEWEKSWALSTGRSVEDHLHRARNDPHRLISYEGVEAIQSAKHFQFLTPKAVICRAFDRDWSGSLMDGLVELDQSIDRLGYLRMTTPERYTRHIGNALSPAIVAEADRLGYRLEGAEPDIQENEHWLLKIPGSGRILWPLYRWLFKVLHRVK